MAKKKLTKQARFLRSNETRFEEKFWAEVRGRQLGGYKFKRQVPIAGFVADFVCERARIIVELDGSHHADQIDEDANRTRLLEDHAYRVIRIWNQEIVDNFDGTLDHLLHELNSRTH